MLRVLLRLEVSHRILVLQATLQMQQLVRRATPLWVAETEPTSPVRAKSWRTA